MRKPELQYTRWKTCHQNPPSPALPQHPMRSRDLPTWPADCRCVRCTYEQLGCGLQVWGIAYFSAVEGPLRFVISIGLAGLLRRGTIGSYSDPYLTPHIGPKTPSSSYRSSTHFNNGRVCGTGAWMFAAYRGLPSSNTTLNHPDAGANERGCIEGTLPRLITGSDISEHELA